MLSKEKNWRREDVKSGVGSQEEVFIGIKAFNEKGGKTLLIRLGNPHTCGLSSQTVKRFANQQVIITDERDSLAQHSF